MQRWNGASERTLELGAWPSPQRVDDLDFPHALSGTAGEVTIQITRTVRRGFYADSTATPGGKSHPVIEGEHSVLRQYLLAIEAAREAIYLENQAFLAPELIEALERALARGVEAVVVVPGVASNLVRAGLRDPRLAPTVRKIVELGAHPRFTLAALAASRPSGRFDEIYVHSKAAIVDDAWATIGSTNLANRSFFGDTELNASFWDRDSVRGFRHALLSAHHGSELRVGSGEALRRLRARALENRARKQAGEALEGFSYALDAGVWAAP